ncbi:hypothetical protein ACEXQB_008945 [Herbiconiux sp. P18]|uniref:hypothetical protein n=1 Tax=Herbiconiux liangxiaofengii TaxID=3342795 RepID=UPI0035B8E3BB
MAENVAASLGAGNSVQVALFAPAEPLLLILFATLTRLLPERFMLLGEGSGWTTSSAETSIVVVTDADAFVNSTPWIHHRASTVDIFTSGLIAFYRTPGVGPTARERESW